MAVKLVCSTAAGLGCGRRDLCTATEGAAIKGWRIRPGETLCPKCAALEPTNEDDGVQLDDVGQGDLAAELTP